MHASMKFEAEEKKNIIYCKAQWMNNWNAGSQGRNVVSSFAEHVAKERDIKYAECSRSATALEGIDCMHANGHRRPRVMYYNYS